MDEKSAQKDLLGKQVGNYIIESIITDGGHYNIFMGKNCSVKTLADDVRTAVKIENDKTSSTTLSREAIILEAVKSLLLYIYIIILIIIIDFNCAQTQIQSTLQKLSKLANIQNIGTL